MTSWRLFKHLTPFRESDVESTPVFWRERSRTPFWRTIQLPRQIGHAGFRAIALVTVTYMLALVLAPDPVVTYCLSTLLPSLVLWSMPSLALWSLPLGLALGSIVVREREQGTWYTLRTIPLETETILLSKARGALMRLGPLMTLSRGALVFAAMVVAVISLNALEHITESHPGFLSSSDACGAGIIVMVMSAGLFLIDRAQQFVLMAVAALAASTTSPSTRVAVPGASGAALLAWMADVGVAVTLVAVDQGGASISLMASVRLLAMLGPVAGYTGYLPPQHGVFYILLTFACREMVVFLLWRWTVRAACLP
jgi:hypothetical protein